jgi:hypothetical protein
MTFARIVPPRVNIADRADGPRHRRDLALGLLTGDSPLDPDQRRLIS